MITYKTDQKISTDQFIDILSRSTLGQRRPIDDIERMKKMLDHADILITAWDGELLVGVSRAHTDFSFCCYLADLAVDENYQKLGIGKKLIDLTHETATFETTLMLLSAPAAIDYYPKVGMEKVENCFVIPKKS